MDSAGHVLLAAHTLYERSGSASNTNANRPSWYKIVGLLLAVASGLCIGVSFVVKKVGLLQANKKYNQEAGEGYAYLKNWMWWTGMTLMILGEVANFAAYIFLDAIIVVSLGCLSVVVTTVLSAIFLKERLSFVGKLGCFNCVVGSIVIALNAPEQSAVADIQDMKTHVLKPGFLVYAGIIVIGAAFTAFWAGPRYGKKSMLVYITICSWIGGLSVVCTQGLGSAILAQTRGEPQFNQWFLYIVLVFVVCTLLTEIIYLNKALNLFNAALVTPTYYVYFTTCTIISSAVLFQGFNGTAISITTVILGFLQICTGVVLLQLAKSSKDVPDTAVFKGDLDQVRTIAEQEEPEYEPRADTIRGSGALMRAISQRRARREADEGRLLHQESMEPIGEDEVVEWDGLRRRKTVLGQNPTPGSLKRAKTIHPPLGMSKFPDDNASDADSDDIHPGFLPRFGRRSTRKSRKDSTRRTSPSPVPMTGITISDKSYEGHDPATERERQLSREHVYGLPPGLRRPDPVDGAEDTAYHSPRPNDHVHFASSDSLGPPRPPPHNSTPSSGNKRTFSFQNVFNKQRADSGGRHSPIPDHDTHPASTDPRPKSRGGLSFKALSPLPQHHRDNDLARMNTEEERLGLVKGDSSTHVPAYFDSSPVASPDRPLMQSHNSRQGEASGLREERRSDDSEEWHVTSAIGSGRSESPVVVSPPVDGTASPTPGGGLGGGLDGLTAGAQAGSGRSSPRRGYQRGRYVDSEDEDDVMSRPTAAGRDGL